MVKSMISMFGLLEVKITAKVRKRGFTPWKAWKKQWCSLKKSTTDLELIIYNTIPVPGVLAVPVQSVIIPNSCVCYRTNSRTKQFAFGLFFDSKCYKAIMYLAGCSESNSQEWIYAIRISLNCNQNLFIEVPEIKLSFTVSLIDNDHSRAAGLLGVYGKMTVTDKGLSIYQPQESNEINDSSIICIPWSQINQCHLTGKRGSVDERKICTVHTSKNFRNGYGQLQIFCEDAPRLLHVIMTQSNKILTTKLSTPKKDNNVKKSHNLEEFNDVFLNDNTTSSNYTTCHRISRSEGDLCGYCDSDRDSGWSSCSPPECNSILTINDNMENASSNNSIIVLNSKLQTDSDDSKLLANNSMNNEEDDENFKIHNFPEITELIDPRRVSGVSIASGVYEEILEHSPVKNSHPLSALYEEPLYMPPPLPPRGRYISQTSSSDDGIEDCDDCNCSTPVKAQSVHNFNIHLFNEISHKSPSSVKSCNLQKLSLNSLNETHIHNNFCLDNTYCKGDAKDLNYIPRCNTEPQTNLKLSQDYATSLSNNMNGTRKIKNRFDLTPIKNKLNYLMRKSNLENDGSPKSRSHFYNSLPRSLNITKSRQTMSTDEAFIKIETSRSCEILDCDIINTAKSENIIKSCELLDCITKTPKADFIINSQISEEQKSLTILDKNLKVTDSLYSNLKVATDSDKDYSVEQPDFVHMQNKWLESECEYVTMSPGIQTKIPQENDYVDMTGSSK